MPNYIPWKVKKFVADFFPEVYYILNNIGANTNSLAHWDTKLESSWNSELWLWPDKNTLLMSSIKNKDDAVIDLGCGNGSLLRHLKKNGFSNLHGLELSTFAVTRLRKEGFEMHNFKLPNIPLPKNSYDFIIASEVLEHILRRKKFMREVKKILRPNGKIAIFVPDNCQGPMDEVEHVRKYNRKSLGNFLSNYLKILKIESFVDQNHSTRFLFALCQKI